jgi:hypothetical protein
MKAEESAAIANSSLEKANSVIDHINSENMQLLAKFQELQSKNQSISQDLASSTAALGLETQKNHDLREQSIRERAAHDATVARIQSEAASELSSASIKASQKLLDVHDSHASQISVLNDKHHSSLTKEADLRERDAKRFMQDIDALRTQLASANKKLASDSEAHSSKLSTVNRQLENAHIENHTLTQRVAFLEGSIEATQQINAHLQTTIDSLLATQMKPDASDK